MITWREIPSATLPGKSLLARAGSTGLRWGVPGMDVPFPSLQTLMHVPPTALQRFIRSLVRSDGVPVRYGVAAVSVVVAAGFYASIDQYLDKQATPFAVFTVPVMIAASFGGMGPGLLATALAWLIGDYYWVEPLHTLAIVHVQEAVHTAVFLGVRVMIS